VIAVRTRGTEAFLTHAITLAIQFLAGTVVGPIGAIALCLFYVDERVRREGFDIEWMMSRIAPAAEAIPPVDAVLPPSASEALPTGSTLSQPVPEGLPPAGDDRASN
jgi:hypothetical protein